VRQDHQRRGIGLRGSSRKRQIGVELSAIASFKLDDILRLHALRVDPRGGFLEQPGGVLFEIDPTVNSGLPVRVSHDEKDFLRFVTPQYLNKLAREESV
jgi:hypothetical protein